uniref:Uncharacterized protein n=1 Tax=Oryza glumipatula TaxID=40148 RepID=A0A0D9ZAJ1_9ORYZ
MPTTKGRPRPQASWAMARGLGFNNIEERRREANEHAKPTKASRMGTGQHDQIVRMNAKAKYQRPGLSEIREIHLTALLPHLHATAGSYSKGPTRYRMGEVDVCLEDADEPSLLELAIHRHSSR